MTRTEFILQTISNSAGPMLAALDTEGNQKFTTSDIKDAANILAQKVSDICIVDKQRFYSLRSNLHEGEELLKEAINEHETSQDWCLINAYLYRCIENIKLAYLQCSDMEQFFDEDEEYRKAFHLAEDDRIMKEIEDMRNKLLDNED